VPKLDPVLTARLNHTVYPKLNHDLVFGSLPNYHEGNGYFYADCPRCHRKGTFHGSGGRAVGECESCNRVIGWFAYLRWPDRSTENDRAIRVIAELAGVNIGPYGELLDGPPGTPTDGSYLESDLKKTTHTHRIRGQVTPTPGSAGWEALREASIPTASLKTLSPSEVTGCHRSLTTRS
jgi:hypothetical protein